MKLYNEKEIGAILQKAAEHSKHDDSHPSVGLTKGELEQLAADAGIDPNQIGRAIAELTGQEAESDWTFWGGPFTYSDRLQLDGEISSGQWEDMLISIRECFKAKGEVTRRESVREWSAPWGSVNEGQVSARTEDGTTNVSVSWSAPLTAFPFYLPVPVAMIAATPIAVEALELSAMPGIGFILAVGALTFLGGRWALRKHMKKVFTRLRRMTGSFELLLPAKGQLAEDAELHTEALRSPVAAVEPAFELDETESAGNAPLRSSTSTRSRE